MPPSIIGEQGEQAKQEASSGSLQKETLQMAMQKLLEYRNVVQSLVTVMKAVDPESVAMMAGAVETGKAIEARLSEVMQRSSAKQPSMAGMPGGQGPQQMPAGGSANGM